MKFKALLALVISITLMVVVGCSPKDTQDVNKGVEKEVKQGKGVASSTAVDDNDDDSAVTPDDDVDFGVNVEDDVGGTKQLGDTEDISDSEVVSTGDETTLKSDQYFQVVEVERRPSTKVSVPIIKGTETAREDGYVQMSNSNITMSVRLLDSDNALDALEAYLKETPKGDATTALFTSGEDIYHATVISEGVVALTEVTCSMYYDPDLYGRIEKMLGIHKTN